MVPLKRMPEEIRNFISQHKLLRADIAAIEQPSNLQQAVAHVASVTMRSFAEVAGQPHSRDNLWAAAHQAATAGPGAAATASTGADLVKKALSDRYHGTVQTTATEAGVLAATAGHLLEVVPAAALAVLGTIAAEQQWTAQQLGEWLRPRQFAPVLPPAPLPVPTPVAAATEAPRASAWYAKPANVLLVLVSVVAVAEFGYILNTQSNGATSDTTAAEATPRAADQYAAIPVANLLAARPKAPVPVVLRLKNGVRQVSGASSTESKLYQFLIDPSAEVDLVDPTKNWIGFDRIYFDSNKATLTNESLWQLSNVASILKRFPTAKIKIGGYTDNSGRPLNNLRLSTQRAEAAKEALVSLGVPADRLVAAGYGIIDNIAPNDTEEGRALNRRVSLQVSQK